MTNYRALATEALIHEGYESYYTGLTEEDAGYYDLVTPLAEAMSQMAVEIPDNDAWTAPEGLAELADSLLVRS